MKKSVWIGIQNKERSVTLHGSLLSVWPGCVCCLLNHGNNPVSPPSPPAEAASVYFQSIEMWEAWPKLHPMNVNNCCRWPATMQPPLQHSPQPAALQHRLQAMWRYEAQSLCLVSAHLQSALCSGGWSQACPWPIMRVSKRKREILLLFFYIV